MALKRYILEIYVPGSMDSAAEVYESDTPFMAVRKGEYLHAFPWSDSHAPTRVLRVVDVEHIFSPSGRQQMLLYTELVDSDEVNSGKL